MEWLLIAVITAAIVVIGALVTFVVSSRRKQPQKAPFKKTYATGSAKEAETEKTQNEIDSAQAGTQPVQIASEEIQVEPKIPQRTSEPTIAKSPTSPVLTEAHQPEQITAQAATSLATSKVDSTQPAEAVAKTTDAADETEAESIQTVAEVTDAEPEIVRQEKPPTQATQPSHFITEIESEPIEAKGKSAPAEPKPTEIESETAKVGSITEPAKAEPAKAKTKNKKAKTKTKKAETGGPKTDTAPLLKKAAAAKPDIKAAEAKAKAAKIEAKEETPLTPEPSLEGKDVNQVSDILNSGKLEDWIALADTSLASENFQAVIHKITKATYPRRNEAKMRRIFKTHAQQYMDTFKIEASGDPVSEYIYRCLAIVLQEDKKYKAAIKLCQKAIDIGLDDGTKTGYPGRIERLKKAQAK